MYTLEVKNISVKVGERLIIDGLSLNLKSGESYLMFGPNGSGKSTLINTIMGMPLYELVSGKIFFMGIDITEKGVDERAKLGISMGFQHPPEIVGVKLSDLLKLCLGQNLKYEFNKEEQELIKALREIDPISRKGVYLSAVTQFNEAMREKAIRKDKRKKEILEKTIKTLTKAVAEM